jgi:hypothetical protein
MRRGLLSAGAILRPKRRLLPAVPERVDPVPAIERGVGPMRLRLLQPRYPSLLSDEDTWAHHMLPWWVLRDWVPLAGRAEWHCADVNRSPMHRSVSGPGAGAHGVR